MAENSVVKDYTLKTPLRKKSKIIRELIKNRALFLMLLPGLVIMLLLNYLPMLGSLVAFKDFKYLGKNFFDSFMLSKWIGLENFKFFLHSPDTFIITRNTILYNLVFILLQAVISIALAIGINELLNKKLAKFYQSSMLLPFFLSWVVVSYLVFGFLSIDKGIINASVLKLLHMNPVDWYTEPSFWPFILVLCNMLKYCGYNCIVYLASLTGIDEELYEAAILDGATKWQQITKVTLPLLAPIIIILILLALGKVFVGDFGLFYFVPNLSGPLFPVTNVIDTYVYRGLMNNGDVGMSSAAGLYQSLVGFILVLVANFTVSKIDKDKALF